LSQEPSVFDGSIEENLLYALEFNPSKEEIEKVIKLAKCEFIYDLPHFLDTQIGEK
jgi:ABC-type multidrug transport system fused ATPase/permease subunit